MSGRRKSCRLPDNPGKILHRNMLRSDAAVTPNVAMLAYNNLAERQLIPKSTRKSKEILGGLGLRKSASLARTISLRSPLTNNE